MRRPVALVNHGSEARRPPSLRLSRRELAARLSRERMSPVEPRVEPRVSRGERDNSASWATHSAQLAGEAPPEPRKMLGLACLACK